jgi:hypothetical protein
MQSPNHTVPQKRLLPETERVVAHARSVPTQSPLLGLDFYGQTPETFRAYVESLYIVPRAKRTTVVTTFRGKITRTATKKRTGQFELTYVASGLTAVLEFDKERRVAPAAVLNFATQTAVSAKTLTEFLTKKKYAVEEPTST